MIAEREPEIKIRLRPLGNGDVEAEIHNGQRGSTLFTGSRETVLKVLAKQFPGVAIEDEDNVPFQPAITGLPQRCKATV